MEIQLIALPLGAFWAAFSSLLSAAQFVVRLRDTAVSGYLDGKHLTYWHRMETRGSYIRAMLGIFCASIIFTGIIAWIGWEVWRENNLAGVALWFAGLFPFGLFVLFLDCWRKDLALMDRLITEDSSAQPPLDSQNYKKQRRLKSLWDSPICILKDEGKE